MKTTMLVLLAVLLLSGCGSTIKTAEYNFYQGVQPAASEVITASGTKLRGVIPPTSSPTVGGNSGAGHSIVVIDVSSMDAEADGALGTQGANAATGAMKDVLSKWTTDLRQTDSNNPAPVTTTTTTQTPAAPVLPVIADPSVPVFNPTVPVVDPAQGEFEEAQ